MIKITARSSLFFMCILASPLLSVTTEKSDLDTLPLSQMLPKVSPKKLQKENALFSSYIKQDKNLPLHQRQENFREVPKFPMHLLTNFSFTITANEKIPFPLQEEQLGERIYSFLNPNYVEKLLQKHTSSEAFLSSLMQVTDTVEKSLTKKDPNNTFAQVGSCLTKNQFVIASASPIIESKMHLQATCKELSSPDITCAALRADKAKTPEPAVEEAKVKPTKVTIALKNETKTKRHVYSPTHIDAKEELSIIGSAIPEKESLFTPTSSPSYDVDIEENHLTSSSSSKTFQVLPTSIEKENASIPTISCSPIQSNTLLLHPNIKKIAFQAKGKEVLPFPKNDSLETTVQQCIASKELPKQKDLYLPSNKQSSPKKERKKLAMPLPKMQSAQLPTPIQEHSLPIHLKSTPVEKEIAEKAHAFFAGEELDFSPTTSQLPNINSLKILSAETGYVQTTLQPQNFTLHPHAVSKEEKISLTFSPKEEKATITANFSLQETTHISEENIEAIKLPKKEAEEDLFAETTYPAFFEQLPKDLEVKEIATTKQKESFSLSKEKSVKAHTIASKKIKQGQPLLAKQQNRSFSPSVADRSFSEEITKDYSPITKEKEELTIAALNTFPEKEFAVEEVHTTKPSNDEIAHPMRLDRIALQEKLPIKSASFSGKVTLPKAQAIEKANFSIHPMLSLFSSPIFAVEEEARFVAIETNRGARMTGYQLFNWPTLEDLNTISLSDSFYLDTRLLDSDLSDEVEFACTIRASEKNLLPPLPIQILYILDASSSIEPHRFNLFKKAILDSLDYLDKNATFNIAVVSKGKISKLRERNISPTKSGKSYAKRFLRKVEQETSATFEGIISVIAKEKALAKKKDYHRCCVLLSDGKFAKNIRVNSYPLKALAEEDIGNFSLYTATASDKNNKQMLSILARLNHGFSLFTRTHASFPRKFSMMIKRIKDPILHDIKVTFPDSEQALTYNEGSIAPILHTGKNLTLFGSTPKKESGRIFIQGRSGDRWVNVVKHLPLQETRKGKYGLHKKLATQKTLHSIRSFLDSGDETHLNDAKKYSEEYDLHTLVE